MAWQQLHFFTTISLLLPERYTVGPIRGFARVCSYAGSLGMQHAAIKHARQQPCSHCASLGAGAIQGYRRSISAVSAMIMPRTSDAQSSRPTVILAQSDAPSIRQRDSITTSTMAPRTAFSRNVERPVELSHNDVPLYLDRCTPQSART
jgi:hypothetical protein